MVLNYEYKLNVVFNNFTVSYLFDYNATYLNKKPLKFNLERFCYKTPKTY